MRIFIKLPFLLLENWNYMHECNFSFLKKKELQMNEKMSKSHDSSWMTINGVHVISKCEFLSNCLFFFLKIEITCMNATFPSSKKKNCKWMKGEISFHSNFSKFQRGYWILYTQRQTVKKRENKENFSRLFLYQISNMYITCTCKINASYIWRVLHHSTGINSNLTLSIRVRLCSILKAEWAIWNAHRNRSSTEYCLCSLLWLLQAWFWLCSWIRKPALGMLRWPHLNAFTNDCAFMLPQNRQSKMHLFVSLRTAIMIAGFLWFYKNEKGRNRVLN